MIFLSPEYVDAMYKANHLKDVLTDKIVEKDYLINYTCKDYKVDYMLKIGSIEYKKMIAQNNINKIKRKIKLIQQLETFDESEIDTMINEEFKEQTEAQKELFNDINTAINYSMEEQLTDEQMKKMNLDYSVLVRSWSPALNEKIGIERARLFENAEIAYQEGNIQLLSNYVKLVEDDEIIQQGELEDLRVLIVKYKSMCQAVDSLIRAIKNSFPYNEREMLEDENLLRERKNELNNQVQLADEELKKLNKKLEKLRNDMI